MTRSHTGSESVGPAAPRPPAGPSEDRRSATFSAGVRTLLRAIEENDEAKVEDAILRLNRVRPARPRHQRVRDAIPGLRLLVSNWRLTLVQILPAMWIWLVQILREPLRAPEIASYRRIPGVWAVSSLS